MGFLGDLGAPSIGGAKLAGLGSTILIILIFFFVALIAGIITFVYYSRKAQKHQFRHNINIFKDIAGEIQPIDNDIAKEVYVPDTNISLYFLKKRKIYIARPTRAMGKNAFWYKILSNGEWVNFNLKEVDGKKTLSEAEYDHRDTRYAYINLKEIIKRNYRDKSVKWWKEYSHLITFIVVSFIFILGCWILLAKIGNLIKELGPLLDQFRIIAESMSNGVQASQNLNSGVILTG